MIPEEEDFIVPAEESDSATRRFLQLAIALVFTLILSSSAFVSLLLIQRWAATLMPPVTPLPQLSGAATATSPAATTPTAPTAMATPTALPSLTSTVEASSTPVPSATETPAAGGLRIIDYGNLEPSSSATPTANP